ncbi:MAG: DUF368 domain-containing protein [Clostridia bacterium]|jgi:putative membrane protein
MNRQEVVRFLQRIGAGALIGLGSIIPGVSGGVLAVTMGLYEKILEAITGFFRNPRRNIIFLLPLGIGAGLGILAFSNVVAWSMANFGEQILFLFIGFVTGGIPSLLRKANSRGFKLRLLLALFLGLVLILMPARLELLVSPQQSNGSINFAMGLICGLILAVGTIVPGMSTSFILMYLGTYEAILRAISKLDIPVLFPMGIGFLLGALAIIKLVAYLFSRHQGYAYYGVLGLLIGSIILVFPGIQVNIVSLLNVLLFICGYGLSYLLEKKGATASDFD